MSITLSTTHEDREEDGSTQNLFAFVESIEALSDGFFQEPGALGNGFEDLLHLREKFGLPAPTHSLWLDCIDADFFLGLDWITPVLDDKDPRQRAARRRNINKALKDEFLFVVQILLSELDKREMSQLDQLGSTQWHRIQVSGDGQQPVLIAADFSTFETSPDLRFLRNLDPAEDESRRLLYNIFNVDFIAEMEGEDFNTPGPTGRGQPLNPNDDSGAALEITREVIEEFEVEESENKSAAHVTRTFLNER